MRYSSLAAVFLTCLIFPLSSMRAQVADAQNHSDNIRAAVTHLSEKMASKYAPLKTGMLDRMAVMDFEEVGSDAKAKQLGKVVRELLCSELVSKHQVKLVERARLNELKKEIDLGKTAEFDAATAQKIGGFLGAQAIVVGSVSEAGPEFIISARLVAVKTGQVLIAENINVNRAGLIALSADAVVTRSKAGAVFRAFIPGWGQFYNGHTTKGVIISTGSVAAIGTAVAMFAVYAKIQKDKDAYSNGGTEYNKAVGQCQDNDCVTTQVALMDEKVKELNDKSKTFKIAGIAGAALFGGLYLWGFIDAALHGKNYAGPQVALNPLMDNHGRTQGVLLTLRRTW